MDSVAVSGRAAKRLRSGHPWIYRSDLIAQSGQELQLPRAALLHVTDERGKFIATALSSSTSQIALRVISTEPLVSDAELIALIQLRVRSALKYREPLLMGEQTSACRLIFSEADELPGVIADRYNDVVTLQLLTQAMNRPDLRQTIIDELLALLPAPVSIVERAEARIRELEDLPAAETRVIAGSQSETQFHINGLRFHFDALAGQKTGAFLDQRENYAVAEALAYGEALDVFCYQGGFALHLARKCSSVMGVDSSRAALETAEQNAQLNQAQFTCGEIDWMEANAFDLLKDYSQSGKQYDTIVLDPPAFAKSKTALNTAIRGYKELNLRALKMLRPGGLLVTCSCSFHVSEQDFVAMLSSAAADAKRRVILIEKRGQSHDHPVVLNIPETSYLKCIVVKVSSLTN